MKSTRIYVALFTILIGISGCESMPHRPDAAMCGSSGDCVNSAGEFQVDPRILLCTDPHGYGAYEDYIDRLELRIRELERRCRR